MSRDELLLTIIRNEVCCVCVHKPTSIEEGRTKDSPKTHKGTGCTYNYDEDSGLYCQLAIKCANQILAKAKQHYEQKRLDRPELRNFLSAVTKGVAEKSITINDAVDRILALIPDIEELDKVRDEITELNKKLDDREEDLIEAKKQERERIGRLLEEALKEQDGELRNAVNYIWQAL